MKYADYYRTFKPFVIDLGCAVSERSDGALKSIAKEASNAATPRLHWECFDWAARMQRRIAVAMVRTTALDSNPRTGDTRRAVDAWRPGRP